MNIHGPILSIALLVPLTACESKTAPSQPVLYSVGPAGNFHTIQAAMAAAPPGSVIEVQPGVLHERVVMTQPYKLRGVAGAILDGSTVDGGTGIGIHVSNVSGVEISGLIVENFERGIVLENVTGSVVQSNEVRNSLAKSGPPFTIGVTPFEGIVLTAASNNDVLENFSHDNGHDGLMMTGGSSGNRVRNNRFTNNGGQTATSVG